MLRDCRSAGKSTARSAEVLYHPTSTSFIRGVVVSPYDSNERFVFKWNRGRLANHLCAVVSKILFQRGVRAHLKLRSYLEHFQAGGSGE